MKNFVLSGGIILNFPSFEKLSIAARSFAFTLGLVAVIAMPSAVFANDNDMEEIVEIMMPSNVKVPLPKNACLKHSIIDVIGFKEI